MNTVHDILSPDISLRALPFTVLATYLLLLWLIIVIRFPRSGSDALVVSQVIVKSGLVIYIGLLSLNFWGIYTAPPLVYDLARAYLGFGSLIGVVPGFYYLYHAIRKTGEYEEDGEVRE